jgi:cysteine-rich repeat protein
MHAVNHRIGAMSAALVLSCSGADAEIHRAVTIAGVDPAAAETVEVAALAGTCSADLVGRGLASPGALHVARLRVGESLEELGAVLGDPVSVHVRAFSADGCRVVGAGCTSSTVLSEGPLRVEVEALTRGRGPSCPTCGACGVAPGATCGNRILEDELCDDGNTTEGDGCSPTCAVEEGFDCVGEPSVCTRITSCAAHLCARSDPVRGDGSYVVHLGADAHARTVLCDMTDGGWTLVMVGWGGSPLGWEDPAGTNVSDDPRAAGRTFRLPDEEIREIRAGGEYRLLLFDGAIERRASRDCDYDHDALRPSCDRTTDAGGGDLRIATTSASGISDWPYFVATRSVGDSWSLDGRTAGRAMCRASDVGCDFTMWVRGPCD